MSEAIMSWMIHGERGLSSECMAAVAMNMKPRYSYHPLDPADLNRCMKLVAVCPEVRAAFPSIRKLSKQWTSVIDHWDELADMFEMEVGWNWNKAQSAKKTYDRMKELGL